MTIRRRSAPRARTSPITATGSADALDVLRCRLVRATKILLATEVVNAPGRATHRCGHGRRRDLQRGSAPPKARYISQIVSENCFFPVTAPTNTSATISRGLLP